MSQEGVSARRLHSVCGAAKTTLTYPVRVCVRLVRCVSNVGGPTALFTHNAMV